MIILLVSRCIFWPILPQYTPRHIGGEWENGRKRRLKMKKYIVEYYHTDAQRWYVLTFDNESAAVDVANCLINAIHSDRFEDIRFYTEVSNG